MDNIIGLAIPLLALIVLGLAAGRIVPHDPRGPLWLNILVVYFALPALIFQVVSDTPVERLSNWSFVLGTTLATYLAFVLMFLAAVLVGRFSVAGATLRASAASYANVGYLGVPLAAAVFGAEGALPAALILCFDTFLQFTLVPLLHVAGRREEGPGALLKGVRSIALNPLIIAPVLGAAWAASGLEKAETVDRTLGYLADAAAPVALFAVGVTMARQHLGRVSWEIPLIAFVKLIVHPVVVLIILLMIGGFDPLWVKVAVLLAALPTAANVFVMANQLGSYVEGASSAILVTTLFSLATVSAVVILIAEGVLPTTAEGLFL